jgi:hypothetical protein
MATVQKATPKYPFADVAIIELGGPDFAIQGLMCRETGNFFVGVPQICKDFQILTHNSSRTFKALLGEDFLFLKRRTKLHPKAINVLSLHDYQRLIRQLDKQGHTTAEIYAEQLLEFSLQQLFCDAFGVEFDLEQKHEFLRQRLKGIKARRNETDAIQRYMGRHEEELSAHEIKFLYPGTTNAVYTTLLGAPAHVLYERLAERGADRRKCNLRDVLTSEALGEIEAFERILGKYIDKTDAHPLDAVKSVAEFMGVETLDKY